MWLLRNSALTNAQNGLLHKLQTEAIKREFSEGFVGFPKRLKQLIEKPIERVLEMNTDDRKIWLAQIQLARTRTNETTRVRERRIQYLQRCMMHRFTHYGQQPNNQ